MALGGAGRGAEARKLAMGEYTQSFKEAMVKKLSGPEAKSTIAVA